VERPNLYTHSGIVSEIYTSIPAKWKFHIIFTLKRHPSGYLVEKGGYVSWLQSKMEYIQKFLSTPVRFKDGKIFLSERTTASIH